MDAYDIFQKIQKYWMVLSPKNSGEILKSKAKVRVVIHTPEGYREVRNVVMNNEMIELLLDEE